MPSPTCASPVGSTTRVRTTRCSPSSVCPATRGDCSSSVRARSCLEALATVPARRAPTSESVGVPLVVDDALQLRLHDLRGHVVAVLRSDPPTIAIYGPLGSNRPAARSRTSPRGRLFPRHRRVEPPRWHRGSCCRRGREDLWVPVPPSRFRPGWGLLLANLRFECHDRKWITATIRRMSSRRTSPCILQPAFRRVTRSACDGTPHRRSRDVLIPTMLRARRSVAVVDATCSRDRRSMRQRPSHRRARTRTAMRIIESHRSRHAPRSRSITRDS